MKKLKTAKLIFKRFGLSGLFRAVKNKIQGRATLLDFEIEQIKKSKAIDTNIIKEHYSENYPGVQNILDLFKDQWACKVPIDGTTSGDADLFNSEFDTRIVKWDEQYPVKGKTILELGPLEGAHTYQMEKLGAARITGIEAGSLHFMKCLIVKNLLNLNAEFLFGDFREYLKTCELKYDIVLACGVLYHMIEPVELLYDISKVTDNIFLCTHYYSHEREDIKYRFESEPIKLKNNYEGYKHYYNDLDETDIILGGTRHYSVWITKDDIISILKELGYIKINILEDGIDVPDGNTIILYAGRS